MLIELVKLGDVLVRSLGSVTQPRAPSVRDSAKLSLEMRDSTEKVDVFAACMVLSCQLPDPRELNV